MERIPKIACAFGVAVVCFTFALYNLKQSQIGPHVVTRTYCGKVLDTFTTTNPEYVVQVSVTNVTPSGFVVTHKPVTNYYWHVWSIFK